MKHGLPIDAVVDPLQPPVPPSEDLGEKSDRGPRHAQVGIGVSPRPGHRLARGAGGQVLEQAKHGVRPAVGPSAHRVHRTLDSVVPAIDGALQPVLVSTLVTQEGLEKEGRLRKSLQPLFSPALAHDLRVRGTAVEAEHHRAPADRLARHAAQEVAAVVVVALVGSAHRHDRLQCRVPESRRLQRSHPAPRDPHHADRAVTPGLLGEPGDHFLGIPLLDFEVLVHLQAIGVAGSAHVDPHPGIAVSCKPVVVHVVARRGGIALAVGDVFEDRGDRPLLGALRQPQLGREAAAVGERYPRMLDNTNCRRMIPARIAHRHPIASLPVGMLVPIVAARALHHPNNVY